MITWESRYRVMYKAARASVTDTSIEVRRSTTAATAPTKPTTSLTSSNIKEDILTQPRRRSADISNRKIKYIMKEMSDIVGRELMDYNLRDSLSQNLNSTTEFYYSKQIKFTDLDLPYILLGDARASGKSRSNRRPERSSMPRTRLSRYRDESNKYGMTLKYLTF